MATTPQTFTWDDQEQKPPEQAGGFKWDDSSAPAAAAPAQPVQPGFLESLGHTFGVGKEEAETRRQNLDQHPVRTILEDQPPVQAAEGLYQGGKRILGEVGQAIQAGREGNPYGAAQHAIQAVPFVGAGIQRGAEQLPAQPGIQNPLQPGVLGTVAGTAAQAAPLALGGWEGLKAARAARLRGAPAATRPPAPAVPADTANVDTIEALDSLARAGKDAHPTPAVVAPVTPAVPEEVAPTSSPAAAQPGPPAKPLPSAEQIMQGLREPPRDTGEVIHAGPPPQPEVPATPQAYAERSATPLLDDLVERMSKQVSDKSPDEISALRDAIDETGRRAHESGDTQKMEAAADAHAALSQLLEDAVNNTKARDAGLAPKQAENLGAAEAALTGKPMEEVAAARGFKWDDQKPAETTKQVSPEDVARALETVGAAGRPVVQASSNPEQIQQSAEEQKPALKEMAAAAVAGVPGAKVEGARVKDAESVANKEDRGKPPETITDHLGGRVSAPTPEAVQQVKQNIEQSLPVVGKDQIDNNGLNATQYAVQTGKPGDANQQSELQVVTTDQAKAMKDTDPLYEKQKEALARGDQKEADRLGQQIKEHFDAAQPEGQPAPAPLPDVIPKGTRVQLQDGRTGTVQWYDRTKQVARVKRDDGKEMPMVPRKALQAAPAAHVDAGPIGNPIPSRIKQIKDLVAKGTDVRIFSARVANDPEGKVRAELEQWSEKNLGVKLSITNAKDDDLAHILDDKANVTPNTNEPFQIPPIPKGKWLAVDLDKTLAYTTTHEPRVDSKNVGNQKEEVRQRGVEAVEPRGQEAPGGSAKNGKNPQGELRQEEHREQVSTREVHPRKDGERVGGRAQGGDGEASGEEVGDGRARPSQEPRPNGQPLGKSGSDTTFPTREATRKGAGSSTPVQVSANEGGSVVPESQTVRDVQQDEDKARSQGDVRELLRKDEEKRKEKGVANAQSGNGGQPSAATAPKGAGGEANAVQKPSTARVLQREPEQDRSQGGGRVQPEQQGNGPAGESTAAAGPGKEEAKPLGGAHGEQGSQAHAAGEVRPKKKPANWREAAKAKKEAQESEDRNKLLADHFAPGNVIWSDYWHKYDKVLGFKASTPERGWQVEVIDSDKEGNPTPGERARTHYTHPDKRDKVIKRAEPKETKPEEKEHKYKFGNTQADIPPSSDAGKALAELRDSIDPADLMGDGLEKDAHVTVRYGIQGDDTAGIKAFIEQQAPFDATLGPVAKFPPSEHSDGAAPLIAPVESPDLHKLNAEIEKHGDFTEPSFKEYVPHATIAYVRPDRASSYVGDTTTEGKSFKVDRISITDRDGNSQEVRLLGEPNSKLQSNYGEDNKESARSDTGGSGRSDDKRSESSGRLPDNQTNSVAGAAPSSGREKGLDSASGSISRENRSDTGSHGHTPQVRTGQVRESKPSGTQDEGRTREDSRATQDALRERASVQQAGQTNGMERLSGVRSGENARLSETAQRGSVAGESAFSPGQPVRISGEGFQDARGNAVRDDEGTIKKFTPAAENHGFNTAVIIRPDGNETRVSWAEGRESPLRPWEEGKAPPRKAAPSPAEKAKVRGELAELERKREEVVQKYQTAGGYYSEGGKELSNQNVELTKQIHAKEDELAKLNGEPTRDERKAMQEQAATTPFDQRPAQAMKYDQPQQSQHWQVTEPDYANRRFEQQAAQYERAVKSDAAEVENAKAGTKAYDKAKASLDWRRAILKRLKDRDDKLAQQYKHEYLELVKKAISKGSPVPDSVIAQYSEFRTARDARERYEKGRHTSFANRSAAINDTMQKGEGFKAKRQDGKAITDAQVTEIKDGIADIALVLGADLRDMMRGTDLTIAHTNGKHPFLSDAGGMYHPGEKSISAGISNWLGQPVRALAHEVGHWFDYESGKVMGAETKIMRGGKRVATAYASEADADKARYAGYGTRAESLYSQALKTMTDTREVMRMLKVTKMSDLNPETRSEVERTKVVLGHYWREPREIFARLFEQYISEKLGRGGLASETPELYHTTPGWWDKDAWAKLEPMVEAEVNKRLAAMRERYAPKAPEATPAAASAPAAEPKPAAKPKDWASTLKAKKELAEAPKAITGQDGKSTTLLTPSRELPATYRLVEADDLQPSHSAHTFAKNPAYPEGLQERAYDTSKEAQNRVIQQAQNYDPRYTVNTNPDAVNGPPVITPTGIVLGGNSRAMSTQRFYAKGGDSYRAALKESAATYGFTPEQVDAMKKPVLVRQVENPSTPDDARRLGSELNKSMTGAMGVAERAVSAGKNIKADTLRNVAAMMQADDSTLREAMGKHGSEIVKMLTADGVITERERPQFVDTATGGLSEEGKTFVERALMGTVIDDPRLMDAAPKSVLQKLERSLGAITSFASRADEWNLLPAIREAVAELGAIQSSGSTVDLRLGQTSLFGNSLVDAMIRALDGKPTAIRKAFDDYARDADQNLPGQARMFGEANAFDAFNASFGSTLTEQEYYDGLEAAATKAPDAPAGAGAQGDGSLFEGAEGNAPRGGGTGQAPGKLKPSDLFGGKTDAPSGWQSVGGPTDHWRDEVGQLSVEENSKRATARTLDPSGTDAGVVSLNHNAYAVVHNWLRVGSAHWNGITLGRDSVSKLVDDLARMAESSFDISVRRPLASIAKQIVEASRETEGRIILLAGDPPKVTIDEEKFHAWQIANRIHLSRSVNDAVMSVRGSEGIARRLASMGYQPTGIPSEIAAKAATGQILDLGFIDQARRDILDAYFGAIARMRGVDVLDLIPNPDKITSEAIARAKERHVQTTEGNRAGAPAETPMGGSTPGSDEAGGPRPERGSGKAKGETGDPGDLNTLYSGGFLDPALFKRLFPDIAERTAQWAGDTVTPGDDQRAMMRETRGRMDRRVAIAIFKLRDAAKDWRTRPRAESIEFWNAVEEGRIASLPPKDQALAQVFKAAFGQMRGDLQKLKPEALQNYIENYFPHIWERSSQVTSTIKGMLNGKKPFAGKGGFLKRRTIPTMQDGLDLGFVPKSWNPVDLFVLKYAEMAQFLMGHQTLQVMKESGTAKFVRLGQKAPDGWTQLDDKIGTVHRRVKVLDDDKLDDVTQPLTYPGGKRKIPGAFSEDIEDATHGELALVGHYYAPADAARVFNNFVSRGIAGRSSIYDTLRWLNDNLNGLQLGISAFHATVTTVNAAASDIALGIEQLMQGKPVKAGASMVSGAAILPTLYRTIRNGSRLMREYLSPGSHAKMEKEADAFAEAGGRVKQNTIELKPLDKAINAFRNGAFLEGLSAVPGALLHAAVAPVMDYYVPRMKVGAFYGMAHNILDEAQRKNWTPELTRARLQEAWDSIDDRFGQVVYDNLFWHKGLRDTLHLAVRAVGYTFGDIRAYGGAVKDTAKAVVQVGRGKKPRVTPRMAFALGSFISTALLGGVMTLAWTGHAPQTWKDYTHPMDNTGQRHTIPGYPDQMISAAHDPIQWSLNKVAPIWSTMAEATRNTDFNHTEIRHKDDPAIQQLAEVAEWAIKQPIPFSFSNTGKLLEDRGAMPTLASMLQEAKEHPGDIALGNLGFTPAPSFVQHSEALNKAYTYERENMPPGTKTKEQAERQQAMHSLRSMFASGKVDRQKIAALKAQGVVNERDLLKARLTSKTDPLVRVVKSLTPEQALNVWNAADAKERKELRSTIEEKSRDIYTKIGNPEKRRELQAKYREALRPTFQVRPGSA